MSIECSKAKKDNQWRCKEAPKDYSAGYICLLKQTDVDDWVLVFHFPSDKNECRISTLSNPSLAIFWSSSVTNSVTFDAGCLSCSICFRATTSKACPGVKRPIRTPWSRQRDHIRQFIVKYTFRLCVVPWRSWRSRNTKNERRKKRTEPRTQQQKRRKVRDVVNSGR